MGKLRTVSQNNSELHKIIMQEPLQISEQEFLSKFSILWNLSRKEEKKPENLSGLATGYRRHPYESANRCI